MQMKSAEGFTKFGTFSVGPARQVRGELRVAGEDTSLYLRDGQEFEPHSIPGGCVAGTLHDLTRVTLVQCVTLEGLGYSMRDGERYFFARLFPHFVLEGRRHLDPSLSAVADIALVIEDASTLFYDFDAFGTVIDPAPHIERIATANNLDRPIMTGPDPLIAYFTGKRDIVDVDTVLGKVRVRHNPSWNPGGPDGVRINNVISIGIEPESPITFDEGISRTLRLLRFLDLVLGRPQNLVDMSIGVSFDGCVEPLKVHWSYRPSRTPRSMEDGRAPHPADVLLDPIRRSTEFAEVLRVYFQMDAERREARERFHASFARQRVYSIDRLIGAANMFDILPKSAAPNDVDLPQEVREAKERGRAIFQALPESYERDSVLSALGRVGKASLKHKTRHRVQRIVDAIGERFPELQLVLDEAVNCRNHYVHGSAAKVDYSRNFDIVTFFTDTLEFVFAASDLIDAGWDIRAFVEKGTTMSHPVGRYCVNYTDELKALRELLAGDDRTTA